MDSIINSAVILLAARIALGLFHFSASLKALLDLTFFASLKNRLKKFKKTTQLFWNCADNNNGGAGRRKMKIPFITKILFIISMVMLPTIVFAAGRCPETADRLEGFANCLVAVRGGAVTQLSSVYGVHLDEDHRELMGAMEANSGVPPQVMPSSPPIINAPFMPMYYPIYPIYPVKSAWFYGSYGLNPYMNIQYSVPLN